MGDSTNPLLTVSPSSRLEIQFEPTIQSQAFMTLKNNSITSSVAFKVKLTDPTEFLVKPATGVVQAGVTMQLQVTMRPAPTPPKMAHKLMIISTELPENILDPTSRFWREISKDQIT
jgi:hypothetical protein